MADHQLAHQFEHGVQIDTGASRGSIRQNRAGASANRNMMEEVSEFMRMQGEMASVSRPQSYDAAYYKNALRRSVEAVVVKKKVMDIEKLLKDEQKLQ